MDSLEVIRSLIDRGDLPIHVYHNTIMPDIERSAAALHSIVCVKQHPEECKFYAGVTHSWTKLVMKLMKEQDVLRPEGLEKLFKDFTEVVFALRGLKNSSSTLFKHVVETADYESITSIDMDPDELDVIIQEETSEGPF